MRSYKIVILSDIHYASKKEQNEGENEIHKMRNPVLKLIAFIFRHFFWMRHPYAHNNKLFQFLTVAPDADLVVACGDFSCDSANIGASYPPVKESITDAIYFIQERFKDNFLPIHGDHDIGKMSLFGGNGGLRLESWQFLQEKLNFRPVWHRQIGSWRLIGICSTLLMLPILKKEILSGELSRWEKLRTNYLRELNTHLLMTTSEDKIILFCHDPTALPYLAELPSIQHLLNRKRIVLTIIGHLHTEIILKISYLLAGMPHIKFLGNSVSKMSFALRQAKIWKQFNVLLCPSLSGCQWLKDGGWLELDLSEDKNFTLIRHYLKWTSKITSSSKKK